MAVTASAHGPDDPVTGIILQIAQHAERLAAVDQREAAHFQQIAGRLDDLARQLSTTGERDETVRNLVARQSALLDTLDGLDKQVAALATRLTQITTADSPGEKDETYQPVPAPRWWKLTAADRDDAVTRLRAWVEQVYRPGYGHLAAALGPCWDQHPLCLYGLDWLMELWSALYLTPERQTTTLASQAEWQTRLLPGLAEQLYLETTRCEHDRPPADRARMQAVENALNRKSPRST